jgi:hypothetical protein
MVKEQIYIFWKKDYIYNLSFCQFFGFSDPCFSMVSSDRTDHNEEPFMRRSIFLTDGVDWRLHPAVHT